MFALISVCRAVSSDGVVDRAMMRSEKRQMQTEGEDSADALTLEPPTDATTKGADTDALTPEPPTDAPTPEPPTDAPTPEPPTTGTATEASSFCDSYSCPAGYVIRASPSSISCPSVQSGQCSEDAQNTNACCQADSFCTSGDYVLVSAQTAAALVKKNNHTLVGKVPIPGSAVSANQTWKLVKDDSSTGTFCYIKGGHGVKYLKADSDSDSLEMVPDGHKASAKWIIAPLDATNKIYTLQQGSASGDFLSSDFLASGAIEMVGKASPADQTKKWYVLPAGQQATWPAPEPVSQQAP